MTFEEHLANHHNADGSFNTAAAEADLATELAANPDALEDLARKAAASERRRWEASNTQHLRKQWEGRQGTLDIDLEAMVPLGDSIVMPLGRMDLARIGIRKDNRTKTHLDENDAYAREMEFWLHWQTLLMDPSDTIADASTRAAA